MSLVYVYGSGECEQLGLGDDQPSEIKKPRKPELFDSGPGMPARSIVKIVCGGMHTLALSKDGSLYSWGCNDEGVLGRSGAENLPLKVELNEPMNGISTGDSHAVAYNTKTNKMYFWGCYRDAVSGRTTPKVMKPEPFQTDLFNDKNKLRIKKVASGANHTLLLS